MKTIALLIVLSIARAAALQGHSLPQSPWLPFAYFWQDALVAIAFAAIEVVFRRWPRLSWTAYSVAVVYIVVNVPVMRVVSTPLTVAMLRAARGPLFDSLWHYVTAANLAWMAILLVVAAVVPRWEAVEWPLRSRAKDAGRAFMPLRAVVAALALVAVLGVPATARVDTGGLDRNAWTALVATARPRIDRHAATLDWREPRDPHAIDNVNPVDLSRLHGAAAGRHIVMVSLESTAARYLGLYGTRPDVTPHLWRLAQSAVVFDNAYAVYPESIKGLFSILCSAYPAFDRAAETMATMPCRSLPGELSARGYRTGLFHSGRFGYLGMDAVIHGRGYDVLEDAGDIGGQRESSFGVDEPSTVARILEWIDGLPASDRFFVTYLPIAGHHPYESSDDGDPSASDEFGRYLNALRYGDAALGELIDGLRDRGLAERTLWIVFGDHGEAFGQHEGNYGHTFQLYDENVRVPFLIAAPGLLPHQLRSQRVVSLIDAAPSVLDVTGVAIPDRYQGSSVLDAGPRMALFFADYSLGLLGLRDGRMKYIYEIESGRSKLFDVSVDPDETRNLAAQNAAAAGWYARRLRSWIR